VTSGGVEVRPLTAERWPDLVDLFGPSGAFSNCWCTWWRQTGAEFERGIRRRGAGNQALLHELTDADRRPGLIAYRDGRPVGWISVEPRPEYGRVIRSPTIGPGRRSPEAADAGVWSIVCFWMPRAERGKGIAMALLRAAVDHARAGGARVLEGYPIDTAGERHPQSSVFTGTLAMFTRAGFTEVERRADGRPIVRLELESRSGA
jgi:GNAT superfamily N-acetyltransferase